MITKMSGVKLMAIAYAWSQRGMSYWKHCTLIHHISKQL
jgi:hypothetical protein